MVGKFGFKGFGLAIIGLIVALSCHLPARAEQADARGLGRTLAEDMMSGKARETLNNQIAKGLRTTWQSFAQFRPDWPGFLETAMSEELEKTGPIVVDLYGKVFATHFSVGEMEAGIRMFGGPARADWQQYLSDQLEGRQPVATKELEKSVGATMKTSDGRNFLMKLGQLGVLGQNVGHDYVVRIFPAVMIRFGQLAEAANVAPPGPAQ